MRLNGITEGMLHRIAQATKYADESDMHEVTINEVERMVEYINSFPPDMLQYLSENNQARLQQIIRDLGLIVETERPLPEQEPRNEEEYLESVPMTRDFPTLPPEGIPYPVPRHEDINPS